MAPRGSSTPTGRRYASSAAELGAAAEALACRHLLGQGLKLLARNYRCRYGEIDLVMRDGGAIVFVEVRMRSRLDFGSGAESVDARKRSRIVATAEHYLQRRGSLLAPCRFDVVSIHRRGETERITWIRDAFGA